MQNDIEQASASNMEEDEVRKNSRSRCCIDRVPKPLRDVNSEAYAPLLIPIGPLHRENTRLVEAMEYEKLKYLIKLTERDGMDEKKTCDIIKNQEERLRNCYSEKSTLMKISSDDFVKMILLDTVFIIQFLLESNDEKGPKTFEPRMTVDLLLLENQLPLFIIKEIYDQATPHSQDAKAIPFLDLATCHFRKYSLLKRVETSPRVEESMHFTDLVRDLMLSGAIQPSNPTMLKYRLTKSAVMLRKEGVRFQVSRDKCLVNITFVKGVLRIPCLEIDRCFERLVRNIMALEHCCYPSEAYICSYIKLMDHLIDSAEDVGLLVRKGIIVHRLGDDAAVSNMINNLCENTEWDPNLRAKNKVKDIETGNIVARLQNKMELTSHQDMTECRICRVPNSFRNVKPEAYTPQLISIGPLHRDDESLKGMEEQKLRYFKEFAQRDGMDQKKIEDLVLCIHEYEEYIRACYSENFNDIESSDFIEMILLDAVFIIEFLKDSNDGRSPNLKPWMIFDIREDLMLLENQLPFFIIEEIHEKQACHSRQEMPFLKLATVHFGKYMFSQGVNIQNTDPDVKGSIQNTDPDVKVNIQNTDPDVKVNIQNTDPDVKGSIQNTDPDDEEGSRHSTDYVEGIIQNTDPDDEEGSRHSTDYVEGNIQNTDPDDEEGSRHSTDYVEGTKHFTDLIRSFMLKGSIKRKYSFSPVKLKYNAVMLRQAGMEFQVTEDKCLVNITFEKGVLKIPRLEVDYCFERLVRNIMAFEQSFTPFEAYVCNYIMFMDHLIDSAGDVDLLAQNRIIHNLLGDDAALSDMINKLCETIPDTYTCYDEICGEMNAYYENRWNRRKATLKLVYFPNVWRGTATVAAAILLILTFIQTLGSVKLFG